VPDGLQRESEEVRQRVHECLLAVLRERGIPFTLLEGGLPQRMRQVEDLLGPP
jgi:nicotinamide riboside kinase